MKKLIPIFFLCISCIACKAVRTQKETAGFILKSFEEKTDYLETEILYPLFSDPALTEMNQQIENDIYKGFRKTDLFEGYEAFKINAQDSFNEFQNYVSAGEMEGIPFPFCFYAKVEEQDVILNNDWVSVPILYYKYEGGAHGNYTMLTYTFSKKAGHMVSSASEASGLSQFQIRDICREELKKSLTDYFNDDTYYKWFMDGTEPTEKYNPFQNFTFDGQKLTIFFEPYQVAPYSAGLLTVEIPVK